MPQKCGMYIFGQKCYNRNVNSNVSTNTVVYTIQKGDTLSKLAQDFGTTVANLVVLNNIKNPNLIYAGNKLIVNSTTVSVTGNKVMYTIQRGDTLSGIAQKFGTTVNNLVRLNYIKNPNLIYAGTKILVRY